MRGLRPPSALPAQARHATREHPVRTRGSGRAWVQPAKANAQEEGLGIGRDPKGPSCEGAGQVPISTVGCSGSNRRAPERFIARTNKPVRGDVTDVDRHELRRDAVRWRRSARTGPCTGPAPGNRSGQHSSATARSDAISAGAVNVGLEAVPCAPGATGPPGGTSCRGSSTRRRQERSGARQVNRSLRRSEGC